MSFTSLPFIGFLLLVFALYYTLPKKAQWPLLLLASLGFYACAGWQGLCYVTITVVSIYFIARGIDRLQQKQKAHVAAHREEMSREARKAYNHQQKKRQRGWLLLGTLLGFGQLAAVKVLGALIGANPGAFQFNSVRFDTVVFLGISFYIFRIMGYLIDVYWGKIRAQRNPFKLALFTLFFPQVLQGPISRYEFTSGTLFQPHKFDWGMISSGLQRVIWGYFKKLLIADRLLVAVKSLTQTPGEYGGLFALAAMLIYAAQLYCDFTGGMDIALGIGEVLGVKMEENFLSPFRSRNIFEYWRRWHITMGTWFRDYIFYPVSVAKPLQALTAKTKKRFGPKISRRVPVYIATIATWFVTGIWHGLAWNFIVWGLLNGIVILISQELQPLYEKLHRKFPRMRGKPYDAFQIVRTFLLMALIRAFDIYQNVPLTFKNIGSILIKPRFGAFFAAFGAGEWFGLAWQDWLVAALGLALVIAAPWFRGHSLRPAKRPPALFWCALVLAILVFGMYGLGFDAASFIYTRF